MISETDLRSAFDWEILSDTTETLTYRKNTTDTIPNQTVRLFNLSDSVFIRVFVRVHPYITVYDTSTRRTLTSMDGIIISPLADTDIEVVFDATRINSVPSDVPKITFLLQAMEYAPDAPVPSQPTVPPPVVPTRTSPTTLPTSDIDDFYRLV